MTRSSLRLTRAQVLAFRRKVGALDERAALYAHPITKSPECHLKGTLHHPHERAREPGEFGTPRAAGRDDDRHVLMIA